MNTFEKTLIILKPDALQRGIVGEIISKFEKCGLKIVATKLLRPTENQADLHYQATSSDLERMGNNTLRNSNSEEVLKKFNTLDPVIIGKSIKKWLVIYLTEGPVICIVLEGYDAIKIVRKILGSTLPSEALPGTIRGDYSHDSASLANLHSRSVRNLVHASGNTEEADYEIALWFKPEEIFNYQRSDEEALFKI